MYIKCSWEQVNYYICYYSYWFKPTNVLRAIPYFMQQSLTPDFVLCNFFNKGESAKFIWELLAIDDERDGITAVTSYDLSTSTLKMFTNKSLGMRRVPITNIVSKTLLVWENYPSIICSRKKETPRVPELRMPINLPLTS